jgi:hypothetical protein
MAEISGVSGIPILVTMALVAAGQPLKSLASWLRSG